jgi:hypothetical protein
VEIFTRKKAMNMWIREVKLIMMSIYPTMQGWCLDNLRISMPTIFYTSQKMNLHMSLLQAHKYPSQQCPL